MNKLMTIGSLGIAGILTTGVLATQTPAATTTYTTTTATTATTTVVDVVRPGPAVGPRGRCLSGPVSW